MIKLLAPTTEQSADDPDSTIILEMSQDTFRALYAAVEVAFDDPVVTPAEYRDPARELIAFFRVGRQ